MNRYNEAIQNSNNAYGTAKNDGEKRTALFVNTVAYVDSGNTDAAMKEMQKQYDLAKNINDAGAMSGDLNIMGNILFEAGRYDEARLKYSEALSSIEKSDLASEVKENTKRLNLYNMGMIELMSGKTEEAKKMADEFGKSATAANNTFQIWLANFFKGMIAMQEKDYKKAISDLEKSNLQNPQTYYYMAAAYSMDGNKAEAKKYAEKCANFNSLINLNQSFVRNKAKEMLKTL
jgi:tetratricopeptide (TPR) repeat protein